MAGSKPKKGVEYLKLDIVKTLKTQTNMNHL